MKIHDDHLYHGAALIQIAEHPTFKAINSLKIEGVKSRDAYKINDNIVVYLKYATKPTPTKYSEYTFTFNQAHLDDLEKIAAQNEKCLIAMVCVKERDVCCITYEQLVALVSKRRAKRGYDEDSYVVIARPEKGKRLTVYVNWPGKKGKMLGQFKVGRTWFPDCVFE